MVDFQNLSTRPMGKLYAAEGYFCEHCGAWEAVSYTNPSLRDGERKLSRYRPGQRQFQFLFSKLYRKQCGVNERGEAYGKVEHPHMVVTGPLG